MKVAQFFHNSLKNTSRVFIAIERFTRGVSYSHTLKVFLAFFSLCSFSLIFFSRFFFPRMRRKKVMRGKKRGTTGDFVLLIIFENRMLTATFVKTSDLINSSTLCCSRKLGFFFGSFFVVCFLPKYSQNKSYFFDGRCLMVANFCFVAKKLSLNTRF